MLRRLPTIADDRAALEHAAPGDLLRLFEYPAAPGLRTIPPDQLAEAWGILFTRYYVSAEDLVEDLASPDHRELSPERIRLMREFIRADCSQGGTFTLHVIREGGNIDRAALIMIADIGDLARTGFSGSTLLHLLADACDKHIRPVLIRQAGQAALAETYDERGVPVVIAILSLSDIGKEDLIAIEDVFSESELKAIRNKNGTGNDAFQIFAAGCTRLSHNASQERNKFAPAPAIRDTKMESGLKRQSKKTGFFNEKTVVEETEAVQDTQAQKYEDMLTNPADNIDVIRREITRK